MRKIFLLAVVCVFTLSATQAQQLHQVSQFGLQNQLFNPGAIGYNKVATVQASYRQMWNTFPGAPKTAFVLGDTYFEKKALGVGAQIFNDVTGPISRTGINLGAAYHLKMGDDITLGFGMEAKVLQMKFDQAKLNQYIPGDPILANTTNRTLFDAAAGAFLYGKNFTLGLSGQQLIQSKLNLTNNVTTEGRLYRHYYLQGSYTFRPDGLSTITPNFLVKAARNAPTDVEMGARVEHNELFWWGLSYRVEQSFMLFAGLHINKKFTVGYAYEAYQTPLSLFDRGGNANEIMLRYRFLK
jgi:type IX secretion system PorP/SprF family membrane protein